MKPFAFILVASLVISNVAARAGEPDPLSTVQALVDAEQAFDIDRAMSLFADEAVIVNAAGAVTTGADDLKRFVDEDMWYNGSLVLQQPAVNGNRVSWTESVSADFYRKLGVAPVRFAFTAVVEDGKIDAIIAHVPQDEIARIETACGHSAAEPLIDVRSCSQFIRYLKNQANAAATLSTLQPLRTGRPG
jgi:hypothetical protein